MERWNFSLRTIDRKASLRVEAKESGTVPDPRLKEWTRKLSAQNLIFVALFPKGAETFH